MTFLDLRVLDILDILLVAFLLYQLYMLTKGTAAINIFAGIVGVYLVWLLVRALNMHLLGSILGQVMGVGVLALIIVFQQEIRNFLVILGTRYFSNTSFSLEHIFSGFIKYEKKKLKVASIVKSCKDMSKTNTGALIVLERESDLEEIAESGDIMDSHTSSRIIESVFFKNSPLHDGGMVIRQEKIYAARCVLPVSKNPSISKTLGLRHRAAIGVTESTDAFVVVVSEENGAISYVQHGKISYNVNTIELRQVIEKEFDM